MIRHATITDLIRITALGKRFHAASGLTCRFDAAMFMRMARGAVLSSDQAALMQGDDGVLIARVDPHPFLPVRVASELLWWVEPSARGHGFDLLRAYEAWARSRGAEVIGMAARDARTEKALQRAGYALSEHHLAKAA